MEAVARVAGKVVEERAAGRRRWRGWREGGGGEAGEGGVGTSSPAAL